MKKNILFTVILLCLCCFIFFYTNQYYKVVEKKGLDLIYLNAKDDASYVKLEKLYKALKSQDKTVVLSHKEHFRTGKFNLYASSDFNDLPDILDGDAINILWIPAVPQGNPEPLRPFDVVVTESMSSFYYLKAINVRTAYIPQAVDIKPKQVSPQFNYPMYYGDNDLEMALALYLAGPTDLKINVFGKGFEKYWTSDEIMNRPVTSQDFQKYAVVLTDQTEESIHDELLYQRVLDILEQGGLPYVRFNNGLSKMFGDVIPMYQNELEFLPGIKKLLDHPQEIEERKTMIREIALSWNSESQAKKFIELFNVMDRKRR